MGEPLSSTAISLTWDPPPEDHHHGEIDSYTVLCTLYNVDDTLTEHTTATENITITGLLPFRTYSCNVSAFTVGHGPFSGTIPTTTLEDVPSGAPTGFEARNDGESLVFLSWSEPDPALHNGVIRHYLITFFIAASPSTRSSYQTPTSETNVTVPGLHPYTHYRISVAAVTIDPGPNSGYVDITTEEAPPSEAPDSLSVTQISPQSLFISWEPPPVEHRNGVIRHYIIRLVEKETGIRRLINTLNNGTDFSVGRLHPFYHYNVSVAAVTVDRGPFSLASCVQMPETESSSPPRDLTGRALNSTSIQLEWEPPALEDQNGHITSYTVLCFAVSQTLIRQSTSDNVITLSGLHPYTMYSCNVSAVTVAEGPFSDSVNVTTLEDAPSREPTNLQVQDFGSRYMTLSWSEPPVEHHNGRIRHYLIHVVPMLQSSIHITTSSQLLYTVLGLHPYSNYTISVAAFTVASGPNATVVHVTEEEAPSSPPLGLSVDVLSPYSLMVSWSQPPIEELNGVIVHYTVTVETGANVTHWDTRDLEMILELLHPNYEYHISVAATTVAQGPYSPELSITMPEAPPSRAPTISVGDVTSRSIRLQWIPPAFEHQNGIITGYVLEYWSERDSNISVAVDRVWHVVSGDPYTRYWVRVAAENSAGQGPFTEIVTVKTLPDVPSRAPTSLTVVNITSTSLELQWDPPPPLFHNGLIGSYIVRCSEVETSGTIIRNSSTSQIVVSGLHPYYTYNCSVSAVTVGPGPFSNTIRSRTLEDAPSGRPYNLIATKVTPVSLTITWTHPEPSQWNGVIQYYVFYITRVEPTRNTSVYTATSLPTSFTGLHPYTAYEVTVAAFTIAHGPNSTTELFRTAEDVPVAPPQNVTAHPISSTELSVTWRPPPQDKQNGKIRHYNISVYQAATDEERWYRTPDSTAHWIVPSLHPYQVYHIRVAAVTIGTSPFSEQVEVRMLEEAPSSPPINLTVVEKGSAYILLEWQSPLKKSQNGVIRHYIVALTEENSTQTLRNLTTVSSQPSINIGSLQAGKTYNCVVSAVTVSPGPFSEPVSFTTETNVPGTVRSLLAVAISPRSMNISWQPPEYSESSKEIIEYQVTVTHFGVVGEDEHLATTASKSVVVGSLHPNYVYQCSVTFRTSEGLGPVAHVLLKLPPDLPTSSPQNVTAVPADATTLHIYWSPPPLMEQNGDIMQYGLNMIDVELEESMQYYLSGSRTSYVVYNLRPHAVYQYTMTAFTAVGNGPYSQAKSIQMLPAAPSAAPFNLSLVEVGSSYALLQWSAPPPRERNGIIQLYQVHWNSSRGETLIINTAGPGTHLLLNSLQSNTRYTCRVAAVTVSAGPLSSAIQFTTNVSAPDTVQSLRGIVLSPQAVNISWLPPLGGKTYLDYQVTITPLYRNGESHQRITSSTGVVVTGLQPGAFYLCVVAARTSAGLQHSVNIVLVEMPPDVPSGFPRGVSHVPFNSRTLRIFWSPPLQEEQNGAIVKYSIKITEVESGEHREYITRDSTTTFVIPNLHPHYHYNYTVAAHTSVGNGPHSPATHLQMPQDAPDAPPLNLTAANSGPQSVNLQWLPPAFDNRNGDITGYIVKIFGIAEREIGNVTSHTVGGLNASTTYSFSVAARTLVGLGPFSQPAYVQTLHGESPAPEGVSAHRISATQIRVTWPLAEKDRAHSPILSYTVKYYPLRNDSRSRRETDVKLIDAKTNITISGLVPILAYGVAVAANTAYGTGSFSDLVTVGLSENSHFQLFFNGAIDCQEWIRYHTDAKLQSMKESLAPELETTCQCLFSTDYMRLNQLQCISAHTDWLIVWGRIVGTNHTDSNGIRGVLQTWSNMESKVVVEGVHLTTLKFCSVSLEAGEPPYCEVSTASGGFPSDTSDPQPSTITYGIVGVVVVMLTMIFVVLVCIVTVTFYKRKKVRDRQLGFHSTHPLNNFNTSTPSNAVAAKCKGVGDSDSNIYDQADSIYETILDSDSPYSQVPSQPPPLPDSNISNKLACEEPVKTAACSGSDSEGYSKTQFFPVKDLSKRCPSPVDYSIVNPKAPVPGCETEYATVDETTRGACLVESGDDYVPMYDDSVSATPKSTYQKLVLDSRDEGSGEYQVPRSVNGDQTSKDMGKGHPEYANFVPAMKSDT